MIPYLYVTDLSISHKDGPNDFWSLVPPRPVFDLKFLFVSGIDGSFERLDRFKRALHSGTGGIRAIGIRDDVSFPIFMLHCAQ